MHTIDTCSFKYNKDKYKQDEEYAKNLSDDYQVNSHLELSDRNEYFNSLPEII